MSLDLTKKVFLLIPSLNPNKEFIQYIDELKMILKILLLLMMVVVMNMMKFLIKYKVKKKYL